MGTAMSIRNLVSALQESSALLHRVNAAFWAGKIDQMLKECDRRPSSREAQKILSWYGGAGSFADLLISTINGHNVSEQDEAAFNDRLDELREILFEEARRLVRDR